MSKKSYLVKTEQIESFIDLVCKLPATFFSEEDKPILITKFKTFFDKNYGEVETENGLNHGYIVEESMVSEFLKYCLDIIINRECIKHLNEGNLDLLCAQDGSIDVILTPKGEQYLKNIKDNKS